MSRLGKKNTTIPTGTTATAVDGMVSGKGKVGELKRTIRPIVGVAVEGNEVSVTPVAETRLAKALWGTYSAHVRKMIKGVNEPFVKKLILEGVGYKVALSGKKMVLNLGFSHQVELAIPEGLTVTLEKNDITVSGIDKDSVGQFTAELRSLKKPEPYKGKGMRYSTEVLRRKQGKKAAA